MTITYLPVKHEGTEAACGQVAFYLRGIPMGRPLSAQDAYTFDGDVPVQMVPEGEGETVNCLSCGKRVGLVTIERMLREVPADPETGVNLAPDDEPAPVAVVSEPASGPETDHDDL